MIKKIRGEGRKLEVYLNKGEDLPFIDRSLCYYRQPDIPVKNPDIRDDIILHYWSEWSNFIPPYLEQ